MKQYMEDYLLSIGLPEPIITKIKDRYKFYEGITSEEIETIFVSEYVNENGDREYEGLWFFMSNFLGEAKQFLSQENFDLVRVDKVIHIEINKTDYDGENANDKSRLSVEFSLGNLVNGSLKASKNNCDFLMKIAREKLLSKV